MKALLFVLLMLCSFTTMASEWTKEQKVWYATGAFFIITDWGTTRDISKRLNEGFHEKNPLLGKYPTTDRVDEHFILSLMAHYIVADYLSGNTRTLFLQTVTVMQYNVTMRNIGLGLRIRF